jgi:hypothetical protein
MRLSGGRAGCVNVPMVLVVSVPVSVGQTFVDVRVIVPLGQVKPDADGHERRSGEKTGTKRLAKQ